MPLNEILLFSSHPVCLGVVVLSLAVSSIWISVISEAALTLAIAGWSPWYRQFNSSPLGRFLNSTVTFSDISLTLIILGSVPVKLSKRTCHGRVSPQVIAILTNTNAVPSVAVHSVKKANSAPLVLATDVLVFITFVVEVVIVVPVSDVSVSLPVRVIGPVVYWRLLRAVAALGTSVRKSALVSAARRSLPRVCIAVVPSLEEPRVRGVIDGIQSKAVGNRHCMQAALCVGVPRLV